MQMNLHITQYKLPVSCFYLQTHFGDRLKRSEGTTEHGPTIIEPWRTAPVDACKHRSTHTYSEQVSPEGDVVVPCNAYLANCEMHVGFKTSITSMRYDIMPGINVSNQDKCKMYYLRMPHAVVEIVGNNKCTLVEAITIHDIDWLQYTMHNSYSPNCIMTITKGVNCYGLSESVVRLDGCVTQDILPRLCFYLQTYAHTRFEHRGWETEHGATNTDSLENASLDVEKQHNTHAYNKQVIQEGDVVVPCNVYPLNCELPVQIRTVNIHNGCENLLYGATNHVKSSKYRMITHTLWIMFQCILTKKRHLGLNKCMLCVKRIRKGVTNCGWVVINTKQLNLYYTNANYGTPIGQPHGLAVQSLVLNMLKDNAQIVYQNIYEVFWTYVRSTRDLVCLHDLTRINDDQYDAMTILFDMITSLLSAHVSLIFKVMRMKPDTMQNRRTKSEMGFLQPLHGFGRLECTNSLHRASRWACCTSNLYDRSGEGSIRMDIRTAAVTKDNVCVNLCGRTTTSIYDSSLQPILGDGTVETKRLTDTIEMVKYVIAVSRASKVLNHNTET